MRYNKNKRFIYVLALVILMEDLDQKIISTVLGQSSCQGGYLDDIYKEIKINNRFIADTIHRIALRSGFSLIPTGVQGDYKILCEYFRGVASEVIRASLVSFYDIIQRNLVKQSRDMPQILDVQVVHDWYKQGNVWLEQQRALHLTEELEKSGKHTTANAIFKLSTRAINEFDNKTLQVRVQLDDKSMYWNAFAAVINHTMSGLACMWYLIEDSLKKNQPQYVM